MKFGFIIIAFIFLSLQSLGQSINQTPNENSKTIIIKWKENLSGDFSFANNWSYQTGIEVKIDGKPGCADGGNCPERCYSMLDSNGVVIKDSAEVFYQLLDTTHKFHSIQCEAWCYEWDGTDFIEVLQNSKDSVLCYTATDVATHCSLQLSIKKNNCRALVNLNSVTSIGNAQFYCTGGYIVIDKKLWENGIMKAEFNFDFENEIDYRKPIYWRGKIFTKIRPAG